MINKKYLTIISGPSAVGKSAVIDRLTKLYPQVKLAISATTRKPRKNEISGIHYYFISTEDFEKKIENNDFLEWAVVHKYYKYGTLISEIRNIQNSQQYPLLEIDIAGLRQIKEKFNKKNIKTIFLSPPSWDDLVTRLKKRNTETIAEIKTRLETSKKELNAKIEFEYEVINYCIDDTVKKIAKIMNLNKN